MELHRFYCERIGQSNAELTGKEAHHLTDVMRLARQESVELFDGVGTVVEATIEQIKKDEVLLTVQQRTVHKIRESRRVILAVSVAKGDRFDWLISRCTELGVDRIVPIVFERTVKLAKGARVVERWNRLAIAAAKQCRRVFLPIIDEPQRIENAIKGLKADFSKGQFLVGSLAGDAGSIIDIELSGSDVIAFVGPEGGFTDEEQAFLVKEGCIGTRLTDTVLRVETAGVAMATVLCALRYANK
jgi:16S rRNA (uracil1498-N3)-methyltransferase